MARAIIVGTPVSPGIAIGPLLVLRGAYLHEKRSVAPGDVAAEIDALKRASEKVCANLREAIGECEGNVAEYADILSAQMELARDPKIIEGAAARIERRKICAAWALAETADELCEVFKSLENPYLNDRAQDIKTIGQLIGEALAGLKNMDGVNPAGILAAYDLSPADVIAYNLKGILGLLTLEGGATSHAAILARGLKIPALVNVKGLFSEARPGETVIVDGFSGCVLLDPDDVDLARYRERRAEYTAFELEALKRASQPAVTIDGARVPVYANLDNQTELAAYAASGADGIGLYRTEFSFLGEAAPDEESLVREYEAITRAADGQKVIFRVLDAGADKILPGERQKTEPNPALGLRGVRFCLKNGDIFRRQLRAVARAGANADIALLLPMISAEWEVRAVKTLLAKLIRELETEGLPHSSRVPVGVMVETPAAVLSADLLAAQCDFFSVGTNDLIHYLMAIDRNNRRVAYLNQPLHPAFLRALKTITDAATAAKIPVSVCGELATDPAGAALLVGLGVNSLSCAPAFVPAIKHVLRKLDRSVCRGLALAALSEPDVMKTRENLRLNLKNFLGHDLLLRNSLLSH